MKTGEAILRRETSHKEVEKKKKEKERGMRKTKETTKCFYCIDLELAAEEKEKRKR